MSNIEFCINNGNSDRFHARTEALTYQDFTIRKKPDFTIICFLCIVLFTNGCGLLSDDGITGTDGELLRALNASHNQNKTIRFEEIPIKVYVQNVPDGKDQVQIWAEATDGLLQFEFVGDEPENGIAIRYGITAPITCGIAYRPEWSEGIIKKASIEIDPKTILPVSSLFCKQTVKHEVGHALGLFGHTGDGGLMDANGGNGEITPQVKRVMKLLYSSPPNTDVSNIQ